MESEPEHPVSPSASPWQGSGAGAAQPSPSHVGAPPHMHSPKAATNHAEPALPAQPAAAAGGQKGGDPQAVMKALGHWADDVPSAGKSGHKAPRKGAKKSRSGVLGRAAKNRDAPAGQPAQAGVSVALFNQFVIHKKKNGGDKEFERRADGYAKQYQAAGWRGGSLLWNTSTPFTSMATLTGAIAHIHTGLQELLAKRDGAADASQQANPAAQPAPAEQAEPTAQTDAAEPAAQIDAAADPHPDAAPAEAAKAAGPDRSTQIRNLAIFTHGLEYGVAVNAQGHHYGGDQGLHKDHEDDPSNIHQFVHTVSGALTPDVNVQLYACSTGRDAEHTKGWTKKSKYRDPDTKMPAEGEQLGGDSFAAHFAQELQDEGHGEASVYGHTNAEHTTENPNARVFGHAAGPGGSKHMFEVLYPSDFIDAELNRLVPELADDPPAQQTAIRQRLRAQMFAHYRDCIEGELDRKNKGTKSLLSPDRSDRYIGMEVFADPAATGQLLRTDFLHRWLTKPRQAAIIGQKGPKSTGMKD